MIFAADPDPDTERQRPPRHGAADGDQRLAGRQRGSVGETAQGGPAGNQGHEVNPTDNHAPVVTAPAVADAADPHAVHARRHRDRRRTATPSPTSGSRPTPATAAARALTDNDRVERPAVPDLRPVRRRHRRGRPAEPVARGRTTPAATAPGPSRTCSRCSPATPTRRPAAAPTPPRRSGRAPLKPQVLNCYSEFLPVKGYVGTAGLGAARDALPADRPRRRARSAAASATPT